MFLSISAFLILNVTFSTLSIVPLDVKLLSAKLSETPLILEFVELVVKTKVFVPDYK